MSSDVQGSSDQVILVTGGYDHTIKLWQAHTGVCQRTAQHTDSVSFTWTVNASNVTRLGFMCFTEGPVGGEVRDVKSCTIKGRSLQSKNNLI